MHEPSDDNEPLPTVDTVRRPIRTDVTGTDTGEASFPASDPPASWTWDVAGRPPGS